MSSFQQLKSSRHKRQAPAKKFASPVTQSESVAPQHKPIARDDRPGQAESSTSIGRPDALQGLDVRSIPNRGRGLFAKRNHAAGEIVAESTPLQAVPSTSNLSTVCSGCLLTTREIEIKTGIPIRLKACTACDTAHYCSTACERRDTEDHFGECSILQSITHDGSSTLTPSGIPSEAVRALGRICMARKRARETTGRDPEWWSSVKAMEDHLDRLADFDGFDQISNLARQLGQYLAHSAPAETSREKLFSSIGFESTKDLLQLCSAFQVNSFTLSLPDVSPIGVAISPQIALANHSCEPNAVVVFPEGDRRMTIVAIKEIQPDQEILTSYIDVSLPYEQRQAELSGTYRFKCDCSLCQRDIRIRDAKFDLKEVDMRAAVWHQQCKGKRRGKSSLPVDWSGQATHGSLRCDRCAETFPVDYAQLKAICDKAVAVLEADARGQDPPDQAIFMLVPILHNLMPPSSYPLLPLLRLQLLRVKPISAQELSHLDTLYNIVVAASIAVYPANHPVLAILHAEWGQVLTQTFDGEPQSSVAARLVKSVEKLRKAYELCGRAFGPGGGLEGKKVADVLRGVEGELHLAKTLGR